MFTTTFLFFSVHASEEEKKKAREKRKVRKKKVFRVWFFVCLTKKNERAKESSYSSEFYSHNTLITNSLIKNVFCAHRKLTGRLERAQRGARGRLRQRGHVLECVLFVLFLSLFLKARLLWWWMKFCGKEEKKSSSSSSSKSMILSLGWSATITFSFFVARHFSFTEKRFFSRKNVCFLRFSRGWAKFFFPRSTHRAQVSSLFGGSMILVEEIRFWLVV